MLSIVHMIILKYILNLAPLKYIDICSLYDANESHKYHQVPEELLTMGRSSFRDVTTLTVFVLRLSILPCTTSRSSPAFHPYISFLFLRRGHRAASRNRGAWEGRGWVYPSRPPRDNFFLLRLYRARIYAGRRINA